MTEHTEKDVLMKCTKLGYEEEVPRQLIDKLVPNEPEENYQKGENINDNYSFSELIQTADYYIQIGDEIDYDEN